MGFFFRLESDGLKAIKFRITQAHVSTGDPIRLATPPKLEITGLALAPSGSMLVGTMEGRGSTSRGFVIWDLTSGFSKQKVFDGWIVHAEAQWADNHTLIFSGTVTGRTTRETLIATSFDVDTSRFSATTRMFPGQSLVDEVSYAEALRVSNTLKPLGLKPINYEFRRQAIGGGVADPGMPRTEFRPLDFMGQHVQYESFVSKGGVAIIGQHGSQRGLWYAFGSEAWLLEAEATRIYDGWFQDGYLGLVSSSKHMPRHLSIYDLDSKKLIFTSFADYSGVAR